MSPDSTGKRPRILFVLENFYPNVGGVETLFLELIKGLTKSGVQVTVLTSQLPGTPIEEVYQGIRIRRVKLPRFARRYFFSVLAFPRALYEAFHCDLIHTTTYNAALPAWFAALFSRRPAVLTVHEVFAGQWQKLPGLNPLLGWGYRLFEWLVLTLPFSHYLCDSKFTLDRLIKEMPSKKDAASVVYPAFDYSFWKKELYVARDLKKEFGLPEDTTLFLYFGRPGISKGLEYLVDAVKQLVAYKAKRAHFIFILSRDPIKNYLRLKSKIEKLGLSEKITILDSVPRKSLPTYILGADCVVLPSVSEGFGYSALEARFIGARVLSTHGHSVEEILSPHIELVASQNATQLASGMLKVMEEQKVVEAIAPSFSLQRHLASTMQIYTPLLSSHTPAQIGTQATEIITESI